MGEKIIHYRLEDVLGPKKSYNITSNGTYYPLAKGIGGFLSKVIINKGMTGTVIMSDQAAAIETDRVLSAEASSILQTVITSFDDQPTYCRRLTVTPGGTTADVKAGDVVIEGTDWYGTKITESFTFTDNASSVVNGTKRFTTVTKVIIPAQDGSLATWDVGERAGEALRTITDPATGQEYPYENELLEGLKIILSTTADIDIIYLESK